VGNLKSKLGSGIIVEKLNQKMVTYLKFEALWKD